MATISLISEADVDTSGTVARPNYRWSLVSEADADSTATLAPSPHKLNVIGEIGKIPYFDVGTDR
jgi:hypothetical protein